MKLKSINKQSDTLWNITIEDQLDVLDYDENNNPNYKTYTTRYNPKKENAPDYIKQKFERMIIEEKAELKPTPEENDLKTIIESIDIAKLKVT